MEWKQIRAELVRVFQAAKSSHTTQAEIAAAGGLSGQTYISKIKDYSDTSLGPQIMNLIRVLEGVGIKPSAFFAIVEQRAEGRTPALPALNPVTRSDDDLALKIGRLWLDLHREVSKSLGRRPRKKGR